MTDTGAESGGVGPGADAEPAPHDRADDDSRTRHAPRDGFPHAEREEYVGGPRSCAPAGPQSADDPRVVEEIQRYRDARTRGESPDRRELLARYPQIADDLAACLDGLEFVDDAVSEVRGAAPRLARPALDGPEAKALGDFRLIREIGCGGMGVVYEAEQISLRRRVAVKVLSLAATLDSRHLQRFHNEAHAAASLKHPGIVGVHSVGCERGVHYYAMEYVDGWSLAEVIEQMRTRCRPAASVGPACRAGPFAATRRSTTDSPTEDANVVAQPARLSGVAGETPAPRRTLAGETPGPQDTLAGETPGPQSAAPMAGDTRRSAPPAISTDGSTQSGEFFRAVAQLAVQAAEALEYAHQMGVVHRDIKPSNLLVAEGGESRVESRGLRVESQTKSALSPPSSALRLWITDFGLAATQGDPGLTVTGDVLGTLRYMSPEQICGGRRLLDHRTDVYSLGATLYELATLRPAFDGQSREEIFKNIVEQDPERPRRLNSALPHDLETIVLKALDKEPAGRYATAQDLADDLRRFLEDRPIRARRPSMLERIAKWSRRHRPVVWSTALTAILAVLVSVVLILGAYEREKAEHQRAEDRGTLLRHYLYAADMRLAHQAWKNGEVPRALAILDRHAPQAGEADLRGFEWGYLRVLCGQGRKTLRGHADEVFAVAFSPDGRTLASAGRDGTARLWDVAEGKLRKTLAVGLPEVNSVAFSPDGATVAVGADKGQVRLFSAATGESKAQLGIANTDVFGIAFSPDGGYLALGTASGRLVTVRVADLKVRQSFQAHAKSKHIHALAFSPDGKTLATASSDDTVCLWDVATWTERTLLRGHRDGVLCVCFSHDGRRIATGSEDRTVRIWDAATAEELSALGGHTSWVQSVVFSADDKRLYSASKDGTARVWGSPSGELLNTLRGHLGRLWCAAISPDGKTLATCGEDRTIKLWDPSMRQDCRPGPVFTEKESDTSVQTNALAFTADNSLLACSRTEVKCWAPALGREARGSIRLPDVAWAAAFSPDRRTVATGSHEGALELRDAVGGGLLAALGRHGSNPIVCLAFSPDGRLLASADEENSLKLWDVAERRERLAVSLPDSAFSLAFSPSTDVLAVASADAIVHVLDPKTGRQIASLRGPGDEGNVFCVAFSFDGSVLASAGSDRVVRLWDAATWQQRHVLAGHADRVHALAFTPDGKTLASSGRDETIRLWSVFSGHELAVLEAPIAAAWLAFSPDGAVLAGGDGITRVRGGIYLWSATPPPATAE